MLTDFLFTPKQDVFSLFDGVPVVSDFGGRCDFTGFQLNARAFKKSATHVVLTYFVVDYTIDTLEFVRYVAPELSVAKANLPVALGAFEVASLPPASSFRMAYLAVQFYQQGNGGLVVLKEQGMTGLRGLGV